VNYPGTGVDWARERKKVLFLQTMLKWVSVRQSVWPGRIRFGWIEFTILGCEAEELSNESGLCDAVFPGNPPGPALPNHVYGFDALQRPPRRNERATPFSQPRPLLHRAMILFQYIVGVLALT
jgi:hypothetical protein